MSTPLVKRVYVKTFAKVCFRRRRILVDWKPNYIQILLLWAPRLMTATFMVLIARVCRSEVQKGISLVTLTLEG